MKRIISCLLVILALSAVAAEAATFTVSNTNDGGAGSLRQAILDANSNVGMDTIAFSIAAAGVQTIIPLTTLPAFVDPVILDGYTQPGASPNTLPIGTDAILLIEISGETVGGTGLQFPAAASGSTIRGMVLNRFFAAITIDSGDNLVVEGNYIGTDATGLIDRGGDNGLLMLNDSQNNTIGGTTPSARNVISGNGRNISMGNFNTTGNVVQGNYLGLNATGTAGIPGGAGVSINGTGPNVIGGTGNARNFISGNNDLADAGISIVSNTTGIQILGNTIGLAADGVTPVPNSAGIWIRDGFAGGPTNITIGSASAPNVIAGNTADGIKLTTNNLFNAAGVAIGYNAIRDNGDLGIDLRDDGITANDTLDGDTGLNGLQNFPVLSSAGALGGNLTVIGSLHSSPQDVFHVQLFHNSGCDPSGNGEGATFLTEFLVTTDPAGNAAFNSTIGSAITTGFITATAMNDSTGDTSEFSACQAVVIVAQPAATIGDVSVAETNAGTTLATFTVFLSAAPPAGASVAYSTADGTATTGDNDYVAASGNAVFAAGQTMQTIDITINGDTNVEPDETFFVNLTGATNATIADDQAIGTIKADDDLPVITISSESDPESMSPLTFTVTVTPVPAFDVTVSYATADSTAVAPSDYTAASGSVTIPAGAPSATFDVTFSDDNMHEQDEVFTVALFDPFNASIGTGTASGTILNDDPIPTVSIDDPMLVEGNFGTSGMIFTATLSNPTDVTVTVPFTVVDDTANVGSDYLPNGGSFTFISPATTRNLQISIVGDTTVEPDETFFVNLGSPTNATLGDSQGVGTILNDDTLTPVVTINDPTIAEGDAGTSILTFTLNLSQAPAVAASVDYTTQDGSATAGSDYLAQSGTVTFDVGQTMATIDITINGDTVPEPNETLFINLSGASNLTIGDNQGVGTLNNDDAAPDLMVTKSGPATVTVGQTFAYTIVVTNVAGGSATGVIVTDVLPAQVTFVSATPTQGSCSGTSTVTCTIGTLTPGSSATITLNVTVTSPGPISNTAAALADQIDANPGDNAGTAVIAAAAAGAEVPTLSEWGLIAMLLALAGVALKRF